jgi:hypothetical protein
MNDKEIAKFLRNNIEPIKDNIYGNIYRGSVYLTDGLFLPCVQFINSKNMTDLAVKRIEEETGDKNYNIIKHFVTCGNRINGYDIKKIEKSKFAFPIDILNTIESETLMSWTGFVVEMNDGKLYNYGTLFDFSFFDLPEKYFVENIRKIINHTFVLDDGTLQKYRERKMKNICNDIKFYREKYYFISYVEAL